MFAAFVFLSKLSFLCFDDASIVKIKFFIFFRYGVVFMIVDI